MGNTTVFDGILNAVDTDGSIITVTMTGNQIKVNISKASITSQYENQEMDILDLAQMVGHDIRLDGLYKEANILYAQQVRVDTEE